MSQGVAGIVASVGAMPEGRNGQHGREPNGEEKSVLVWRMEAKHRLVRAVFEQWSKQHASGYS